MRGLCVLALTLIAAHAVRAQYDRFELGRRLVEVEDLWNRTDSPEARKRAVEPLANAVNRFFAFRFGNAAQSLDQARHLLRSPDAPPAVQQWCDAIGVNPQSRLLDAGEKTLPVELRAFYKLEGELPAGLRVEFRHPRIPPQRFEIDRLPLKVTLNLSPAKPGESLDGALEWEFLHRDRTISTHLLTVSCVERLQERLEAVRTRVGKFPAGPRSLERATLDHLLDVLKQLAERNTLETNYPAAKLLAQSEQLAAAIEQNRELLNRQLPGEFWAAVPVEKYDAVVRIAVPPKLSPDRPTAVVFALHGAGGSENLFFDGYGAGITAKICAERGWIMVAPRSPGFIGLPAVGGILDELQKRYPIDPKRVYLVGHSMGAAQSVGVAQQIPDRIAAVAALGGGGQVKKGAMIQKVPFFVGVGSADFARAGARGLEKNLKAEGVARLKFQEYPDVEHLMIVPAAIRDVFAFLDAQER